MTIPLKIIFAGTPLFAAKALEEILRSAHTVIAVYTQPDKPAGRGLKLTASAVKQLALAHSIPTYQPDTLKTSAAQEALARLNADIMVVAAYGMILPKAVLNIPRLGCINIHPSLLPRWRGAAPIQRTLFAGDKETGVSIMQMDEGLDTGPVLLQKYYAIRPDETAQTLHDELALIGAKALIETLDLLAHNAIQSVSQSSHGVTYAHKITKAEAMMDWSWDAMRLQHAVQAFNPWPVMQTTWQEQTLRVWMARALATTHQALPGTVLHASTQGIDVATGQGVLRLLQLQLPGGKVLPVADFYHAKKIMLDERLGQ